MAGDPDRAEAWLRDMEVAGLSPGLVTINSVMNASAKAGDAQRAGRWMQDLRRRGLDPDDFTCSTIISACVRGRDPHQAAWWLKERPLAFEGPLAELPGEAGLRPGQAVALPG